MLVARLVLPAARLLPEPVAARLLPVPFAPRLVVAARAAVPRAALVTGVGSAIAIALSFFMRRVFRRAALLRWSTPLDAALSSERCAWITNVFASSAAPTMLCSALWMNVFTADLTARLRVLRRSATRICFSADRVLGKECSSQRGATPQCGSASQDVVDGGRRITPGLADSSGVYMIPLAPPPQPCEANA